MNDLPSEMFLNPATAGLEKQGFSVILITFKELKTEAKDYCKNMLDLFVSKEIRSVFTLFQAEKRPAGPFLRKIIVRFHCFYLNLIKKSKILQYSF